MAMRKSSHHDPAARTGADVDRQDGVLARRLREAVTGLGILGMTAVPQSRNQLLELLVRNAMQITTARAGTLRLLDRDTDELVFEVIEGSSLPEGTVEKIRSLRAPLGEGLAGWVAAT